MQALLADVAMASDETTLQLNPITEFRIGTYMAKGDSCRLAANMCLPEEMEIVMETILAVEENDVTSRDGTDCIRILKDGLREGVTSLPGSGHKYVLKACLLENNALPYALIDKDTKEYCQ